MCINLHYNWLIYVRLEGYSLPDTWTKMKPTDRYIKVQLQATDQEYINLMKELNTTIPANQISIIKVSMQGAF